MSTSSPPIVSRFAFAHSAESATRSLGRLLAAPLLIAAVNVTTFDFVHNIEGSNFFIDWQTLLRLTACAAFGLYGLAYLPHTLRPLLRFPGAWATILLIWAFVTVPFSLSPVYSATAVFASACVTLFAPAVLAQLGSRKTMETLLAGLLLFVGLNWLLHFTVPSLARSEFIMPDGAVIYRFGNDAQQLGLQIAWALGLLLTLTLSGQKKWRAAVLPLAILLVTLPLTQSRTAILASLAASGVAVWLQISNRQRLWAILGGGTLLSLLLFALALGAVSVDSEGVARRISRSGGIEELKNFTGRTEIWEYAWERILESPVIGYGYGASRFALQEDPNYPFDFQANHAHNLYLNTALCLGFPGLLLLLAMLGNQFVKALLRPSALPWIALAIIGIASITEPVLYGPMPRSHMVIWLIALFWPQQGMDIDEHPENTSSEVLS